MKNTHADRLAPAGRRDRPSRRPAFVVGLLFVAVALVIPLVAGACVHVPLRARQDFRRQQFFASHPEVSDAVAGAISSGHVITGMTREQVWVVAGDPIRKSFFRAGDVEVWFYPAVRFHQGAYAHGATSFRMVFVGGLLQLVDPF